MVQRIIAGNPVENKYQHLRKTDGYLRAEIKISRNGLGYQFKLSKIDDHQGSFFVNENSSVLKVLNIGSVLDMKYWTADKTRTVRYVTAEINGIARQRHEICKSKPWIAENTDPGRRLGPGASRTAPALINRCGSPRRGRGCLAEGAVSSCRPVFYTFV